MSWYYLENSLNDEVHTPMNEEIQKKIRKNNPKNICNVSVNFEAHISKGKLEDKENAFKSYNNEKFNIGNILFWEDEYIIVGILFNYLDIIDYNNKKKVDIINTNTGSINDFRIYNISEKIDDPEYGSSFIMRDNKGKIQYARPSRITDKLNYKLIKSGDYFNDLEDDEKLTHIPLIVAIYGYSNHNDSLDNTLYISSFINYIIYAILGFWFKGCVYDIKDESHTKRTCTKISIFNCLVWKISENSMIAFRYCQGNKS
jgi:hypothetical protein